MIKEIKTLKASHLSDKFGLTPTSQHFVFKAQEFSSNQRLGPHRSELYGIGIVLAGEAQFNAGTRSYAVSAPGLLVVPPEQIRQWNQRSENLKTISIFFTEEFVVSGLSNTSFLKDFGFFKANGTNFIKLSTEEINSLKILFTLLQDKYDGSTANRTECIQAILRLLLFETAQLMKEQQTGHSGVKCTRGHQLTEDFKEIVSLNLKRHRSVSFYAERLFVTPKHLSQMVKQETGKTASELIDEMVTLEAKVLLQSKYATISEISEHLNFTTPSFFGKFFKRNTGISPFEYKKTHTSF
jgi:AraC family transcriptional activator of pobA